VKNTLESQALSALRLIFLGKRRRRNAKTSGVKSAKTGRDSRLAPCGSALATGLAAVTAVIRITP
jgi:hypothetical protein